ncbi:hypothetical protein ONZ51_g249 [Trametes cubensis]|uniref:Isochorismatase-like domain-containing protein n=1 Tax=Trametes cubensis TaxID=1111947 RepID=A0AAD7U4G8_9APHY|nr:hypothetical protein ONZ51_g249 [Trametes cubensis]
MASVVRLIPGRTVFFVCDIQTRFRPLIYGFDHVVATSRKMLKLAKDTSGADYASVLRATALGGTAPELDPAPLGKLFLGNYTKSAFSMAIPPVISVLRQHDFKSIVLFGIEVSGYDLFINKAQSLTA